MSDKTILFLESFLISFIIGVNIFIFVIVYPIVSDLSYDGFEKNLALGMMFIVPIASAFLIYVLLKSKFTKEVEI